MRVQKGPSHPEPCISAHAHRTYVFRAQHNLLVGLAFSFSSVRCCSGAWVARKEITTRTTRIQNAVISLQHHPQHEAFPVSFLNAIRAFAHLLRAPSPARRLPCQRVAIPSASQGLPSSVVPGVTNILQKKASSAGKRLPRLLIFISSLAEEWEQPPGLGTFLFFSVNPGRTRAGAGGTGPAGSAMPGLHAGLEPAAPAGSRLSIPGVSQAQAVLPSSPTCR